MLDNTSVNVCLTMLSIPFLIELMVSKENTYTIYIFIHINIYLFNLYILLCSYVLPYFQSRPSLHLAIYRYQNRRQIRSSRLAN